MIMSTNNTVCIYTEFAKKNIFELLTLPLVFLLASILPVENLQMRHNMKDN